MKRKKKQQPRARITAIGVTKLYNTGNYTNVKYDLSAEVPKGASAAETLRELAAILVALRPLSVPSCLDQLRSARRKKLSERSEYEKEHFSTWLAAETEYHKEAAKRERAVEQLDNLGGCSVSRDAKNKWEDDDTPW